MKADLVVNTAAMHNVQSCEKDPLKAYAVNAIGARNLAAHCLEVGATLVHVSTDYVFDGSKHDPHVETDLAMPINVYGSIRKLAGELFIQATTERHFILRTSALYRKGTRVGPKRGENFIELYVETR